MPATPAEPQPYRRFDVDVRLLQTDDPDRELWHYLSVQATGFGDPPGNPTPDQIERFRGRVRDGLLVALAWVEGRPAGTGQVSVHGGLGEMVGVATLPELRRRGVAVRVLLDPGQDVNRPSFALLRGASTEVRWFRPPPGGKLHAKAVLADGLLLLGSANWSRHGLDVNHELDVVTADAYAAAAYASRFEADWQAAA